MEKWYLVNIETFNTLTLPGIEIAPSNHNVIVSLNQDKVIFRPQVEYTGNYLKLFGNYQELIQWMYNVESKEERNWNSEYIDPDENT